MLRIVKLKTMFFKLVKLIDETKGEFTFEGVKNEVKRIWEILDENLKK